MEKKDIKDLIKEVFSEYCKRFSDLLGSNLGFKPWDNAWKDNNRRSIHESNQVSKFLEVYREKAPVSSKVITWMELPVKIDDKTNHIDGFIADTERKNIFFIEAKRYSRKGNLDSLGKDVNRSKEIIKTKTSNNIKTFKGLNICDYNIYVLCLVDIWEEKSSWTKDIVARWDSCDNYFSQECLDSEKQIIEGLDQKYYLGYHLLRCKDGD